MSPRTERILANAKNIGITVAALAVAALAIVTTQILWQPVNPPQPAPIVIPDDAENQNLDDANLPPITEAEARKLCGWPGEDVARPAFEQLKDRFVNFRISTAEGEDAKFEDKRSVLWDAALKVNGGKHLLTFRQAVGDCVSMGAANAVNYLTVRQIASGQSLKYRPAFQPYIYGTSRVLIGKGRLGCNSDGSVGSWAADAVQTHGILFADHEGVPAYSGSVARQWGCRKSTFEEFLPVAKEFPVKGIAQVTTFEQVRDALINGYPVTVASSQGFEMSGVVRDGKLWGVPRGQWMHQMCFIGYDPNNGKPGVYCLNSWGANAHGVSPDGAPPGGFWVDKATVSRMVKQGDSFAYSEFQGFPLNDQWDLSILLQEGRRNERRRDRNDAIGIVGVPSGSQYSLSP